MEQKDCFLSIWIKKIAFISWSRFIHYKEVLSQAATTGKRPDVDSEFGKKGRDLLKVRLATARLVAVILSGTKWIKKIALISWGRFLHYKEALSQAATTGKRPDVDSEFGKKGRALIIVGLAIAGFVPYFLSGVVSPPAPKKTAPATVEKKVLPKKQVAREKAPAKPTLLPKKPVAKEKAPATLALLPKEPVVMETAPAKLTLLPKKPVVMEKVPAKPTPLPKKPVVMKKTPATLALLPKEPVVMETAPAKPTLLPKKPVVMEKVPTEPTLLPKKPVVMEKAPAKPTPIMPVVQPDDLLVTFPDPTPITIVVAKAPQYVKIGHADGELLESANDGDCVEDKNTGLIWEKKTQDRGLRDAGNFYSWYNPKGLINGGHAGVADNGKCRGGINCDTDAYVKAVNELKLCGFSGWRLPTRAELMSLVQYRGQNKEKGLIDRRYFPNATSDWYWAADSDELNPTYAWYVLFFNGRYMKASKSEAKRIRLVTRNKKRQWTTSCFLPFCIPSELYESEK